MSRIQVALLVRPGERLLRVMAAPGLTLEPEVTSDADEIYHKEWIKDKGVTLELERWTGEAWEYVSGSATSWYDIDGPISNEAVGAMFSAAPTEMVEAQSCPE